MKVTTAHEVAKALAEHDKKMGRNVDRPMDLILAIRDKINKSNAPNAPKVEKRRTYLIIDVIHPLLEKYKDGVTSHQLAVETGIDANSIMHCLKREFAKGNLLMSKVFLGGARRHFFALKKYGAPVAEGLMNCDEAVFDYFRKNQHGTAKQVAETTGYVPGTISKACKTLVEQGVLRIDGYEGRGNYLYVLVQKQGVAA